jgi:hypothetical protein
MEQIPSLEADSGQDVYFRYAPRILNTMNTTIRTSSVLSPIILWHTSYVFPLLFVVLISPDLKNTSFWDITPCSPLKVSRRFGGTYRLHL